MTSLCLVGSPKTAKEPSALGLRLAWLAMERGLSQRAMSAAMGVSFSLAGQLIRGDVKEMRGDKLEVAAKGLGVDLTWLVTGEGQPTPDLVAPEDIAAALARPSPTSAPQEAPRRAFKGRWRVYADSNLSFSYEAELAAGEGGLPDAVLDAAVDLLTLELGAESPSPEQATRAIDRARQSGAAWAKYRSTANKKPGTVMSAQQSIGHRGSSTSR